MSEQIEHPESDLDDEARALFGNWSATRKALKDSRAEIDRLIHDLAGERGTSAAQRELISQLRTELSASLGREALAIAHAARVEALSDAARQSLGQKPQAAPAAAWLTGALDQAKGNGAQTDHEQ